MLDKMFNEALKVREQAHAPYSGFKVGTCICCEDGRLFSACNVENIAYPQSQCSEASAIGVMVAAGERRIVEVMIVADGEALCTPCGGCRQRLSEFADPEAVIHIADLNGVRASFTLGELLPHAFDFDLK